MTFFTLIRLPAVLIYEIHIFIISKAKKLRVVFLRGDNLFRLYMFYDYYDSIFPLQI